MRCDVDISQQLYEMRGYLEYLVHTTPRNKLWSAECSGPIRGPWAAFATQYPDQCKSAGKLKRRRMQEMKQATVSPVLHSAVTTVRILYQPRNPGASDLWLKHMLKPIAAIGPQAKLERTPIGPRSGLG